MGRCRSLGFWFKDGSLCSRSSKCYTGVKVRFILTIVSDYSLYYIGAMMDRKEKIMQASIQLFVERGFHNASTRMIAEQAGVSEGLIFRHFRSKDELLDSLLQQGADEMYQAVAEIISEHEPKDFLSKLVDSFFDIPSDRFNYWRLRSQIQSIRTEWEPEEWERYLREGVLRMFKEMGFSKFELEAELLYQSLSGIRDGFVRGQIHDPEALRELVKKKYRL